jgi:hypothetical protein
MENSSKVFAESVRPAHLIDIDGLPQAREYWPMARAAHLDLQLMTVRRMNVLLMGTTPVVEDALNRLMAHLREPVRTWRFPDPLELPPAAEVGTLILRDVESLPPVDQCRLLRFLELSGGRTQIVSTSGSRLLARVEASVFLDTLYYRLNTVCVDVTN